MGAIDVTCVGHGERASSRVYDDRFRPLLRESSEKLVYLACLSVVCERRPHVDQARVPGEGKWLSIPLSDSWLNEIVLAFRKVKSAVAKDGLILAIMTRRSFLSHRSIALLRISGALQPLLLAQ